MDIIDRCNELEEMIDKLNELLDTVQSKDIFIVELVFGMRKSIFG